MKVPKTQKIGENEATKLEATIREKGIELRETALLSQPSEATFRIVNRIRDEQRALDACVSP